MKSQHDSERPSKTTEAMDKQRIAPDWIKQTSPKTRKVETEIDKEEKQTKKKPWKNLALPEELTQ